MIYEPREAVDRPERVGRERELAAAIVGMAIVGALVFQFSCRGVTAGPARWLCPNSASMSASDDGSDDGAEGDVEGENGGEGSPVSTAPDGDDSSPSSGPDFGQGGTGSLGGTPDPDDGAGASGIPTAPRFGDFGLPMSTPSAEIGSRPPAGDPPFGALERPTETDEADTLDPTARPQANPRGTPQPIGGTGYPGGTRTPTATATARATPEAPEDGPYPRP